MAARGMLLAHVALLVGLCGGSPAGGGAGNTSAHLLQPVRANLVEQLNEDCLSYSAEAECPAFCSWDGSSCFANAASADDVSSDADKDVLSRALATAMLREGGGVQGAGGAVCSFPGSEVAVKACDVALTVAWCLRLGLATLLQCAEKQVRRWIWKLNPAKEALETMGSMALQHAFVTLGICAARAEFLTTLVISGTDSVCPWLVSLGCNKQEDGKFGGECEDYAEMQLDNCSKVSRRSDGNFKPEARDRFKCILPEPWRSGACPPTWSVTHGGVQYACAAPSARSGNQTECKTWCQNIRPVGECLSVTRGAWGKNPGQFKCVFDPAPGGECRKDAITVGDKVLPCVGATARKSNATQCKTWCADDYSLDLVPSRPRSTVENCTEATRTRFRPDQFKCAFLQTWDPTKGQPVCANATIVRNGVQYPCEAPTNLGGLQCSAWCQNVRPIDDDCLAVSRAPWGSWRRRAGQVKCTFEKDADGKCSKTSITVDGKPYPCEEAAERNSNPDQCKTWCADLDAFDLVSEAPDDAATALENCSDVSRTHDNWGRTFEKEKFKCISFKHWDDAQGKPVCPAESVVVHGGQRYNCGPTKPSNGNSLTCKAWCDNLPRVRGCSSLERGTAGDSNKVKCVFDRAGDTCVFGNLTHLGDVFPCGPAESTSWLPWVTTCQAWCTDDGKLDLVSSPASSSAQTSGVSLKRNVGPVIP